MGRRPELKTYEFCEAPLLLIEKMMNSHLMPPDISDTLFGSTTLAWRYPRRQSAHKCLRATAQHLLVLHESYIRRTTSESGSAPASDTLHILAHPESTDGSCDGAPQRLAFSRRAAISKIVQKCGTNDGRVWSVVSHVE